MVLGSFLWSTWAILLEVDTVLPIVRETYFIVDMEVIRYCMPQPSAGSVLCWTTVHTCPSSLVQSPFSRALLNHDSAHCSYYYMSSLA